jgi:hypothetical protein
MVVGKKSAAKLKQALGSLVPVPYRLSACLLRRTFPASTGSVRFGGLRSLSVGLQERGG